MTTFTPEQLRKVAELGKLEMCDSQFVGVSVFFGDEWHPIADLPRSLPACFDVLERFCEERGLTYTLTLVRTTGDNCAFGDKTHFNLMIDMRGSDVEDWPEACADTKQSAIISAILKAAEKL